MKPVVCVGDVLVDVIARLPGPLAPGSDTPAAIEVRGGGAAANVAAWVADAGLPAMLAGRVGDDVFGTRALAELSAGGVVTTAQVDRTRATGTCVVLVAPGGERTMIPDAGANAGLGELDPAEVLPAEASCLYVSGYALLGPGSRPFARDALALGRQRGWRIVVDAASAAPLVGAPGFLDWAGRDVLLLANEAEALVLTELDEPSAAAQSLALRCGQAVVKRGAQGAVWSDGSGVLSVPAVEAEAVDTTGAGDAFAAGLVASLVAGDGMRAALTLGAQLAARAIGRVGARP